MSRRKLWEMIGREREGVGGVGKDVNSHKHAFFFLPQLVRGFLYCKHRKKKKWSSSEQASNETVAKKSWRYLFGKSRQIKFIVRILSGTPRLRP